ncbi:ubiquitin carboxyl-terminal hydrolase 28 isoform X1 [Python bivittatus]|uniref:ubiquitinyl hydrolase 1 n=1 Tax=Python bivittatus TaxID=176946 RepID=A0A9F3QSL9_PYTBI|nr:ubiquitin carboxyl-terminal hydrolase 28 isoform X1 [Python bivittatus]
MLTQACSLLLNQLKEITGVHNPLFLQAALKAAGGNLMQAVGFLPEGHDQESGGDPAAGEGRERQAATLNEAPQDHAGFQEPVSSGAQDLSADKKDFLATMNAHYEPSMAENKNRSKRKRCEVWGENATRRDWRRARGWPAGMKNIGNTCWFSAVIQSLFQLPEFRRLVLNYSLPEAVLDNCRSRSEKRNIAFMQELQYLFALMLGTRRKFVDPTTALELLRGAFRSPEEQQQDVSEFTHKLLDWLEDAFQLTVDVKNSQDKSENPMVQLFYGTFLTEGVHEGITFSKIETFGQYPLQVNGYKNLHECLEGAMVEKESEPGPSKQPVTYKQERWFTKLPPVLTFELSRFEFNQSLGQPEKIHNKLEFPPVIYMDRFMYGNKEIIQAKREEIGKLKDQMTVLQQQLEKYVRYGSGADRFPLPDMLQHVLEFARTRPSAATSCAAAVTPAEAQAEEEASDAHTKQSRCPAETSEDPAPRAVSTDEMNLVISCLQQWREEVEQDIKDLKTSMVLLSESMDQVYADPELRQVPYHLHAVLVHEGQANAGHYWAYIYNPPQRNWLKYNDIAVTESSWEELERDSFGGSKNASAYCLIYVSKKLPHFAADYDDGQTEREVEVLPLELQRYIEENNWRVEQEMAELEEQSYKMAQIDQSSPSLESQNLSSGSSQEHSIPWECGTHLLSSEHTTMAKEQTAQAVAKTADACETEGIPAALEQSEEADPEKALPEEASPPAQAEEPQETEGTEPSAPPSSQVSEVEIPSVGKILVRSDADGYNEEVMLSPAMQGVILAIAKARQTFDRDGSEAGLVKAFREEYSRLYSLSRETPTPQNDPRLQHVLVYLLQNDAPKQVVERTLLEQFADKNLSYDDRSISIMKVAREKLKGIGPDEVDMEEYKKWHEDYSLFRKVSVYLLTGLELYQKNQYCEALTYLVYAYQTNAVLQAKGPGRGADSSLIALYRRKCLLKLNDAAAALFESSDGEDADQGVSLLNELIIPCMHLLTSNNVSRDDLDAIEVMRNRWCAYLGKDMGEKLQMKLGEFLPRLLDCSPEGVVLKEPPKIRPNSPYDLCSRFAAVMESIHGASAVTVK